MHSMHPCSQGRSHAHLCCDAHWACVGVALAHHDAAQSDQRGSSKPKLLCTQQRCNCDVTACAHLPISLLKQHMQTAASEPAEAVWTATQGFEALTRALNVPGFTPNFDAYKTLLLAPGHSVNSHPAVQASTIHQHTLPYNLTPPKGRSQGRRLIGPAGLCVP
jgi:hypothetical protein